MLYGLEVPQSKCDTPLKVIGNDQASGWLELVVANQLPTAVLD